MPSGAISHQDNVVVRIDDAGNHGPAFEVHDLQSACREVAADRGESPVADDHLRDDPIGRVHRMDAAVDEREIGGSRRTLARLCPKRWSPNRVNGGDAGSDAMEELSSRMRHPGEVNKAATGTTKRQTGGT